MKKNIIYLLLLLGFAASCDVLDVEPPLKYSEETAWRNEKNCNMYVSGFYAALKDASEVSNGNLSDGYTDLLKYSSYLGTDHNRVLAVKDFITSANGILGQWNDTNWERIRRNNEFLADADVQGKHLDPEFLKLRKAETRFIRAFLYYRIIKTHGGVIIRVADERVDDQREQHKARASEEDSWKFVMQEFEEIAEILPEKWEKDEDQGRVTKGAAYAMLAKCALYAKNYDKAIEAGKKVEELEKAGIYGLMNNYNDVFTQKFNKELIIAVYFKKPEYAHEFDRKYVPSGDKTSDGEAAGGWAAPTEELVGQFDIKNENGVWEEFDWSKHSADPWSNRDPRFYSTVLYNGATWKGRTLETYEGGADGFIPYSSANSTNSTVTGYYIRKFLDENNTNYINDKSDQYGILMRYAEVLFILSEAYAEKGDIPTALTYLNKIRTRAGMPNRVTNSKDEYFKYLEKEKCIEMAFEGQRLDDLKRWRRAKDIINGKRAHGVKITKLDDGSFEYQVVECDDVDRYFPDKYYLLPIIDSERKNNNLCTQNPLW